MKWYFCMNEEGLERYAPMLRIAVASARAHTTLDPHLVYDGGPRPEIAALGVTVHHRRTPLMADILALPEGPGYRHRIAAGAFLRLEIAAIEQDDDHVLYTDCDVMFQAPVALDELKPATLAAAPEFARDDWSYFNSGVMLFNVAALKQAHEGLLTLARARLGIPDFYDQGTYNEFFKDRWERLPVTYNWKPYWGRDDTAPIVHFHGPKLPALDAMLEGGDGVVHDVWRTLFDRDPAAYRHYHAAAKAWLAGAPRLAGTT